MTMTRVKAVIGTYNNPEVNPAEYLEKWSKLPQVVYVTG